MEPIAATLVVALIAGARAHRTTDLAPIRISVVAAPGLVRTFIEEVVAEADAIWQVAGIAIVWDPTTSDAAGGPGAELTVVLEEGPRRSAEGIAALGWIRFAGPDAPEPEIHLSRGNAEDLMARTATMHDRPVAWQNMMLARALGRALAHEMGHYLLKSRAHTPHGLMQAVWPSAQLFSPDRLGFAIAPDERDIARAHLPCAPG